MKDKELKKKAKLGKLKDLKKMMMKDMHGGLEGKIKEKVTVASDSKEGLKEGLSKAQDILSKRGKSEDSDEYKDGGCGSKDKYEDGGINVEDGIDEKEKRKFFKNLKKK